MIRYFDLIFHFLNLFPYWPTVTVIGTSILLFRKKKEETISFIISMICVGAVALFLKSIIYAPRPCAFQCPESSIFYDFSSGSFPSQHAMSAFAPIPIFHKAFKNKFITVFLVFSGILVSYSRVYLNLHYFIDILVGAILGFTISSTVLLIIEKLNIQ